MVTMVSSGRTNSYVGKSGDTKPNRNVPNGSRFYDMTTGKKYMFDAETEAWVPQETSQGSSSNGGNG